MTINLSLILQTLGYRNTFRFPFSSLLTLQLIFVPALQDLGRQCMRFFSKITSNSIWGLSYQLIELFYIGIPVVRTVVGTVYGSLHDRRFGSQAGRTRYFARSATRARSARRGEEKNKAPVRSPFFLLFRPRILTTRGDVKRTNQNTINYHAKIVTFLARASALQ